MFISIAKHFLKCLERLMRNLHTSPAVTILVRVFGCNRDLLCRRTPVFMCWTWTQLLGAAAPLHMNKPPSPLTSVYYCTNQIILMFIFVIHFKRVQSDPRGPFHFCWYIRSPFITIVICNTIDVLFASVRSQCWQHFCSRTFATHWRDCNLHPRRTKNISALCHWRSGGVFRGGGRRRRPFRPGAQPGHMNTYAP